MDQSFNAAREFLELSSEQRLRIILLLSEKKSKVSVIAKEIGATVPEVFRNFERLAKSDIIEKDAEGYYHLTTYGTTISNQIPSFSFVSENKKYFKTHNFGTIPQKFIQRIGALDSGKYYKGFTRIMELWAQICQNAEKYIYDILSEEPPELIEPIVSKAKSGVSINSIFSETAIIPKDREKIIEKLGVRKLASDGILQRRIKKDVNVIVILNEKEECVMFPDISGDVDMSETFYSTDQLFHEWCLDYFRYCWSESSTFQESKIHSPD
jgi:predicted transcriptional regulator